MSAPSLAESIGDLRDILSDMRLAAEETSYGYGVFPGGDPNTFTPDPEWSTDAECAAHKADCVAWDAGKRTGLTDTCSVVRGQFVLSTSGYGLGAYTVVDDDMRDLAERLERVIGDIESAREACAP